MKLFLFLEIKKGKEGNARGGNGLMALTFPFK
jgi:hypothetical protein